MNWESQLFADAFHHDPYLTFVFPDPDERGRLSPLLFSYFLRLAARRGRKDAVQQAGIALWHPPHVRPLSAWDYWQAGMAKWPTQFGIKTSRRIIAVERDLHRAPQLNEPAWHLMFLAVAPHAQGQGLSRQLTRAVFAQADTTGTPIRLETNNLANISLYEKFGFRVTTHLTTPGIPEQWIMVRAAQTA